MNKSTKIVSKLFRKLRQSNTIQSIFKFIKFGIKLHYHCCFYNFLISIKVMFKFVNIQEHKCTFDVFLQQTHFLLVVKGWAEKEVSYLILNAQIRFLFNRRSIWKTKFLFKHVSFNLFKLILTIYRMN